MNESASPADPAYDGWFASQVAPVSERVRTGVEPTISHDEVLAWWPAQRQEILSRRVLSRRIDKHA